MTDPSIQSTPSDPAPHPGALPPPPVAHAGLPGLPFTLVFVALHAALWCALAVYLLLYVPPAERMFRDFNMTLPRATHFTLAAARWVWNYWYILPFWLAVLLAADGGLLLLFYRRRRSLAWAWALLNIAVPVVLGVLAFLTIQMPMWKLLEGLSR
jgi:type II secretory pathway component PulF